MEEYFGIKYEFEKENILRLIDQTVDKNGKGYVCVADGVTLASSYNNLQLKTILNNSLVTVCDSGWVPLYLKMIYGIERKQYAGSELFSDIIHLQKYGMAFVGSSQQVLDALKNKLSVIDPKIAEMPFIELPFCDVEDFDYNKISQHINHLKPHIIWISLGMPKQEIFMHNIEPLLNRGVLIGVGAAFNFFSGIEGKNRAPEWMIKCKIEWLHRIFSEPKKQIKRCWLIVMKTPFILLKEYNLKNKKNAC